jgi:hypothetical protein
VVLMLPWPLDEDLALSWTPTGDEGLAAVFVLALPEEQAGEDAPSVSLFVFMKTAFVEVVLSSAGNLEPTRVALGTVK